MKPSSILAALVALSFTTGAATAQDMQPGQWDIALTMTTPSVPDQSFGPFTQGYCISAADVANPTRLLGIIGAAPSTCTYGNQQTSGNEMGFSISCQGAVAMDGSGHTSWTQDTLSGTLEITTHPKDNTPPLVTHVTISAHRTGGC